jgi:tetratricopeptide (TPR) repeat protein
MSESSGPYDPLEQWKADYNRTGTAPLETLAQLAHMSRWIAGYKDRSADAHLVLFALTRDSAYLFRALQVLDALPEPDGTGSLDLMAPAVPLFTAALGRAEAGTHWHTALLRGRATALYSRAQTGGTDLLAQAVEAFADLLAALPPDDADRPSIAATCAHTRRRLAGATDDLGQLAVAAREFEAAAAGYPPDQPGYANLLLDAAGADAEVAERIGEPGAADRAFELFERAAGADPQLRAEAADGVEALAYSLLQRWQAGGPAEDFERSLAGWRAAVRLSEVDPPGDPDRLTRNLNNLVGVLQLGRDQLGRDGDLDEQVACQQRLVAQLGDDDPDLERQLVNLALLHRERFRLRHRRADIDAAVGAFARAVGAPPGRKPSLALDLGLVMRERYESSGELGDVDAALAFWRALVEATPPTRPEYPDRLGGLVGTLVDRYRHGGGAADLDAAVDAAEQALAEPTAHRSRLRELAAVAVQERYRSLGRGPDLDRLVLLSREAFDETAEGDGERTRLAADHAFFLLRRFDRESGQGDLDDAVALLDAAAPGDSTGDGARARWLTLLGEGLLKRYGLWGMGQLDELARARESFEQAVGLLPPGAPGRVDALCGLAAATERVFVNMPVAVGDRDLPVSMLEQALAEAGDDPALAGGVRRSLAQALLQRAGGGRERPGDLRRAIGLLEQVATGAGEGFDAGRAQVELAGALRRRYQRGRRPADRARAVSAYRAGLPAELETMVDQAMADAAEWGAWAAQRRSWAEAAEAFTVAIRAADEIYLANVGRGAAVWLSRAAGLAAEAGYALARAGRAADAALVLEAARFRAGSEALELVRADLGELSRAGHPELAGRLREAAAGWRRASHLVDALPPGPARVSISLSMAPLRRAAGLPDVAAGPVDEPPEADGADGEPGPEPGDAGQVDRSGWRSAGRAGQRARHRFEAAVGAIREVTGFEQFLDPPSLDDIQALGERVPLVYLASAVGGGLAVAFRPGRPPRAAFLPGLRRSSLDARLASFREAYQAREADQERWRAELAGTTRWLWDAAMARTLALLGGCDRVVLVPSGLLGLLPFHAAWRPDARASTGRRYACDRLVIGYAPNARSVPGGAGGGPDTLLAVEDPAPLPAPLPPLSFAGPEVAAAAGWFPEATVLRHEDASVERVTACLPEATVYHLACHGFVDLPRPRRSALVLAGGRTLTLQQLLDLRLDGAGRRLAVLTGCETALAGTAVPDEVVSLPAALLQAGMTGVVATQWAVTGLPAAFLAARFYHHWRQEGLNWADSLAAAQRWLRDSTDGEKARFTHPKRGAPALPVATRRPLWRAVAGRDPGGRSFAGIADWGAFTYMGDPGAGAAPEHERRLERA